MRIDLVSIGTYIHVTNVTILIDHLCIAESFARHTKMDMEIFKGDLKQEFGTIKDHIKEIFQPVSDDCPVRQLMKLKGWADIKRLENLL